MTVSLYHRASPSWVKGWNWEACSVLGPDEAGESRSALGQEIFNGSRTTTKKLLVPVLPAASVATQVTTFVP